MKKFLLVSGLFLMLLLIIGLIGEYGIHQNMKKGFRYHHQEDWEDMKNINAEMVFLGNSRTFVHVNPEIIKRTTHVSSAIIAMDGQGPQALYYKLHHYLENNTAPKIIGLQFDPFFYSNDHALPAMRSIQSGFFMYKNKYLHNLSNLEGYSTLYHYIPLSAYQSGKELFNHVFNRNKLDYAKGYTFTKGFKGNNSKFKSGKTSPLDMLTKKPSVYLDSIFSILKEKNIKIMGITYPLTKQQLKVTKNIQFLQGKFNTYCKKYQISNYEYLNTNGWEMGLMDSLHFYNHTHLNLKGANILTENLIIRSQLIQSQQ